MQIALITMSKVTKNHILLLFLISANKSPKVARYAHIISTLFFYFLRQYPHILANDAQHDLISPSSNGGQPHIPEQF